MLMTGTAARWTSRPRSNPVFRHQTPAPYGSRAAHRSRRRANAAGSRAVPRTTARQRSGDTLTQPPGGRGSLAGNRNGGQRGFGRGPVSSVAPSGYNYFFPRRRLVSVVLLSDHDVPIGVWIAVAVAAIGVLTFVWPSVALRPFFWLATRTAYRIRVLGTGNVPVTGPALLLSNHVTYVDWLLIWYACPRKVRFVAWAGWTKYRLFRWFLRATNSILIDGHGGPKQLVRSLRQITAALDAGEAVCLFPEGALSRAGGVMLPFRRGFERVLSSTKQSVPVVPVSLTQLWGSVFSYAGGTVLAKWPERIPYRVTVAFGKPLPPTITAPEVRLKLLELSAETMITASDDLRP